MSRYQSKANALLACSVLLVASIGCSPGTPTDPSSTPQNVVVSPNFVRILSTSGKSVDGPAMVSGPTSKLISAQAGGVVTNGRVTLEFPPYALFEDTEITIEMATDGTLGVELGPHGIRFNRPVTMWMDLRGTTAEGQGDSVRPVWYNPDQGWWEYIDKVDGGPDESGARLEHFSSYKSNIGG